MRRRFLVLTYHRVLASTDPQLRDDPTAADFDRQLGALAQRFNVLRLDEAVERCRKHSLPPATLCITFDDGYADNREVALPVLQRHGVPATFFVATRFLDGGRMWNDTVIEALRRLPGTTFDGRRSSEPALSALGELPITTADQRHTAAQAIIRAIKHLDPARRQGVVDAIADPVRDLLPNHLMMTTAQVRELHAAGMAIGAHTVSHPVLTAIDEAAATREMADSRAQLQAITGAPVALFAYPNGRPNDDYDARHTAIVRQLGFAAAMSTAPGFVDAHSDFAQLPRVTAWDYRPVTLTARLLRAFSVPQAARA
jgi:peptidoglycan/xylan/chitin deacetylase (PgdA/CDA1 family)